MQKFFEVKQGEIRQEPDLDCKDDVEANTNQPDWCFPLFSLQYDALHCVGETQQQLIFKKRHGCSD